MNEVRFGIIGMGNMGRSHVDYMSKLTRVKLTAVCDHDPAQLEKAVTKSGVKGFSKATDMMASGLVDAVIVAVPHYDHIDLTIKAFEHGLHVVTEKPIAVTAKDALRGIEAKKKYKKLVWSAMFNQRTNPAYRKVRELVKNGDIGEVIRTNWIITNWFRSQAYYNSGGWRATWGGEGGGVLVNQCPHNLDLWQWICGMPNRITSFIGIGKYHKIEVEDEVTAYADYPNGATGLFITSTGEAPGTNRLEVTGDKGKIICDGSNRIEIVSSDESMKHLCATTKASFPHIVTHKHTIEVGGENLQHVGILRNFVDAVLDGTPLLAPAEEGINGVELANAMIMSGLTNKPVPVPTDHEAYDKLLKKLIKGSTFKKTVIKAEVDMGASFR